MVRQDPDEVQKEVQQQDDEFYGEETPGGSDGETSEIKDAAERLSIVTGDDLDELEDGKEVSLADDIEDAEDKLRPGADDEEEEVEHIDDEALIDPFGRVIGGSKKLDEDEEDDETVDDEE